jgi:hypothetical protein
MTGPVATTRTVAESAAAAMRLHVAEVSEAYVSASAPEWAELYVHLSNGQRFYVTVVPDDTD